MEIDVYVPILVSALLALCAGPVGRRLPPWLAVQVLVPAGLATAVGWICALGLLCGTAVGQLSFVAAEGHWSRAVLRADDPVAGPIAYLAGAALVAVCGALAFTTVRRLRAVWLTRRLARQMCSDAAGELVVLPDDAPQAFALPGRGAGRIVVSAGMLRALDAAERRVLFAHERAHLRGRHHWWLLGAQLAAAANPLLTRLPATIDYLLERSADEAAACAVGDRRLAARALARAGLAALDHPVPAHAAGVALAYTSQGVSDRVRALLVEPPRTRWQLVVAVTLAVVVAAVTVVDAGNDVEDLFEHATQVQQAMTVPATPHLPGPVRR